MAERSPVAGRWSPRRPGGLRRGPPPLRGSRASRQMIGRRSLLGLTFCTCYLASHLTNKVSVRTTARGLRAVRSTSPELPRAGWSAWGPRGNRLRVHSPELPGLGGPPSRGGCGPACTNPRAASRDSPTLSVLGRWRQEDAGFKVILSYPASLRPAWDT